MAGQPSSIASPPPMIVRNPDGSYTRRELYPSVPPKPDLDSPVLSKDVPFNPSNKTSVRIFLPKQALDLSHKLPLMVYYHGGGFVYLSTATDNIHEFCEQMAELLVAVVVSVDYRLAPEHRLPAAYDDAVEALLWIKSTQERWLTDYADFSNCYVMGTSAGANIAYNAGLRAALQQDDLLPLKINGLILHHLFIGGVERTGSEIRLANAGMLTLSLCDNLWELSLPVGANRDHEYSNPMMWPVDPENRIRDSGWRVMVACCYGDLMIDRQMELGKMMEEKGIKCWSYYAEGSHGEELFDKSKAKELLREITKFISSEI